MACLRDTGRSTRTVAYRRSRAMSPAGGVTSVLLPSEAKMNFMRRMAATVLTAAVLAAPTTVEAQAPGAEYAEQIARIEREINKVKMELFKASRSSNHKKQLQLTVRMGDLYRSMSVIPIPSGRNADSEAMMAWRFYTEAIQLDPAHPAARRGRVEVFLGPRSFYGMSAEQVLEDVEVALAAESGDAELYRMRAELLARTGAPRETVERAFEEALARNDGDAALHAARARFLLAGGLLAEAAADAERAARLDPALAEAHYLLGAAAHMGEDEQAALRHYARAIELDPYHIEARLRRADIHEASGNRAALNTDLNVVNRLQPYHPHLEYMRGLHTLKGGDRYRARYHFQKAVKFGGGNPVYVAALRKLREMEMEGAEKFWGAVVMGLIVFHANGSLDPHMMKDYPGSLQHLLDIP